MKPEQLIINILSRHYQGCHGHAKVAKEILTAHTEPEGEKRLLVSCPKCLLMFDAKSHTEPEDENKHSFWEKVVGNDDWDKETGEYHGLER